MREKEPRKILYYTSFCN